MDEYDDEDDNQTPTPKNGALNFFSRDSSRALSSASSVNNLFKKTARERTDASSASSRKSGIVASEKYPSYGEIFKVKRYSNKFCEKNG